MDNMTICYSDIADKKIRDIQLALEDNQVAILWNYFDRDGKHYFDLNQERLVQFYYFIGTSLSEEVLYAYMTPYGVMHYCKETTKMQHKLLEELAVHYREQLHKFLEQEKRRLLQS